MIPYVVEIPDWHPIRTNELIGSGWRSVYRRKTTQHNLVAAYFWKANIPFADIKRRVTLLIILGPRQRGGDPDAYWKVLLDSLVKCHALVDDRKEWVELEPVQYERGDRPATFIMLEDVESSVEKKRRLECTKM